MKQNKLDEQWLDEIRQTLTDHEEELPADGWEKIVAALSSEAEKESVPERPIETPAKKNLIPLWLSRSAAAIAIIALVLGGFYFFSVIPTFDPTISIADIHRTEVTPSALISEGDSIDECEVSPSAPLTLRQPAVKKREEAPAINRGEAEDQRESLSIDSTPESADTIIAEPSIAPLPDMHYEEQTVLLAMGNHSTKRTRESRTWKAGLRLSGSHMDKVSASDVLFENILPDHNFGNPDSTTTRLLTRGKDLSDVITDSENHLSWSAGLSVSRQLNNRLALETGLTYTYLSSDVILSHSGRQHQQVHYLGIPLKLNAMIAEGSHWQIYTSLGTMLEHSLWGKRGGMNMHLNDWQWSVNAGLGMLYKLNNTMGLYLEPALYHYFDNGSDIPSLRTESPYTFNLQIGVRFEL